MEFLASSGGWKSNLFHLLVLKPIDQNHKKHTCGALKEENWEGLLIGFGLFMDASKEKLMPQGSNLD